MSKYDNLVLVEVTEKFSNKAMIGRQGVMLSQDWDAGPYKTVQFYPGWANFFLLSELRPIVKFTKLGKIAEKIRKGRLFYSYENLPVCLTSDQIEFWEREIDYQFDLEVKNQAVSGLPPIMQAPDLLQEAGLKEEASEEIQELSEDQLYDFYFVDKLGDFKTDFAPELVKLEKQALGFQPSWIKIVSSLGVIALAICLGLTTLEYSNNYLAASFLPLGMLSAHLGLLYWLRDKSKVQYV